MLSRNKRKKSAQSVSGSLSIEHDYDNPCVVALTSHRQAPPRNRLDLTNANLEDLFGVRESHEEVESSHNHEDETSFAADMMKVIGNMKIKKRLDLDSQSQTSTQTASETDRATCCTLNTFASEDTISEGNIPPMVMTPSSAWNIFGRKKHRKAPKEPEKEIIETKKVSSSTVREKPKKAPSSPIFSSGGETPDSSLEDSVSLGSLDPKLLGPDQDSESTLLISDKSDDDMMTRGKPAVVLGYQTSADGDRTPCVMLGMIANRDLDGYEDLLDPDNKPMTAAACKEKEKLAAGIKSVRFNLNVEYIEDKNSYEDLYGENFSPRPRAGVFKKTTQRERDSPIKRLRTPVAPPSDSPTYDELTDDQGSTMASTKAPEKPKVTSTAFKPSPTTNPPPSVRKRKSKKEDSESTIEMVVPRHNNIGDIKRFHNRSRFHEGIDLQPDRTAIKGKQEDHYYYDPNHEMSEYYYYYDSDNQEIKSVRVSDKDKSLSLNRKKRRLQKLKQQRADKEHLERVNLQKRFDQLEDAVDHVAKKEAFDQDSDLAVGEGTFKSDNKKLHFGRKQIDGFHLKSKERDPRIEEEEFTEDLSSDSTGLTPGTQRDRPQPVLNIGATDKKLKDFGPALEFEREADLSQTKINDNEDLLEPATIVHELMMFNKEHDSLSEYNQRLEPVDESSIEAFTMDKPENVEFGFTSKKKRGKAINVAAFNRPVDIVQEHDRHDVEVQRALKGAILQRKEALRDVVTNKATPDNVIEGLEITARVGRTEVLNEQNNRQNRKRDSDNEYQDTYDDPPGQTHIGTVGRDKSFLLKKKDDIKTPQTPMSETDKRKQEAGPQGGPRKLVMATIKQPRPGTQNRTVEQDFMVREVKAGRGESEQLFTVSELSKLGVFANKMKKAGNKKKIEMRRRKTGFGKMPGTDLRFGEENPYYSEPANTLDGGNTYSSPNLTGDLTYSYGGDSSLAKDIAVDLTKKAINEKASRTSLSSVQSTAEPLESIASDLIKSELVSSIEFNENGTIKIKRDKLIREEIMHATFKNVLDELIIQVAIEAIIDVEASNMIKELDERDKIQKKQNALAYKWIQTADPNLARLKAEKKTIPPATGPLPEDYDKENDISQSLWYDQSPPKKAPPKVQEVNLRTDLAASIDGTYLPTPRAGGAIWSSSKLPPRKQLLTDMIADGKCLIEWIRSGVPAVFLNTDINDLTSRIIEELDLIANTVIEMLDSKDPASGELVQSAKLLRHEMNRDDPEIKTIQFLLNCLMVILNCFETATTFIDPKKFTQIHNLIMTLTHELRTQALEASQSLNFYDQKVPMPSAEVPKKEVEIETTTNPQNDVKDLGNIENWSMSEEPVMVKSDDDQTIISTATSCTVSGSYDELVPSETEEETKFRRLARQTNTYCMVATEQGETAIKKFLFFARILVDKFTFVFESLRDFCLTNTGEKVFLGSILVVALEILRTLMFGDTLHTVWAFTKAETSTFF